MVGLERHRCRRTPMPDTTLTDFLRHPITGLTALVGTLASTFDLLWVDAVWQFLLASSGQLFQILSLAAFSLAPRTNLLPEDTLTTAAVAVGLLYVGSLAYGYLDRAEDTFDDDET